jgi:hypothetical protein
LFRWTLHFFHSAGCCHFTIHPAGSTGWLSRLRLFMSRTQV